MVFNWPHLATRQLILWTGGISATLFTFPLLLQKISKFPSLYLLHRLLSPPSSPILPLCKPAISITAPPISFLSLPLSFIGVILPSEGRIVQRKNIWNTWKSRHGCGDSFDLQTSCRGALHHDATYAGSNFIRSHDVIYMCS